jgi:hypothetical protein
LPTDQINLTDEESRIMPAAGGGFEQCYNAQAVVAAGSMLVVAVDVVPVFGIIKSVMGFRQFSMRGLEKVRGEWSLVTMAWNIKRMFTLMPT